MPANWASYANQAAILAKHNNQALSDKTTNRVNWAILQRASLAAMLVGSSGFSRNRVYRSGIVNEAADTPPSSSAAGATAKSPSRSPNR